MWLSKRNKNYYWYDYTDIIITRHPKGVWDTVPKRSWTGRKSKYIRPAKFWEVILNKLFKWQPRR